MSIWEWVAELKPAQATVFGTALGSGLGLLAITLGALLNAALNRRRDRVLHRAEQLNLLRSITIEIARISMLVRHQNVMLKEADPAVACASIINPLSLSIIYSANVSKLHLLPPQALYEVIAFYIGLFEHEYNAVTAGVELIESKDSNFKSLSFGGHLIPLIMELNGRIDNNAQTALSVSYPLVRGLEKELRDRVLKPENVSERRS